MNIKITKTREDGWVSGLYKKYTFQARVFDEPSDYGIDGGRISKLYIRYDENYFDEDLYFYDLVVYDRGWSIKPKGELIDVYEDIIYDLENLYF